MATLKIKDGDGIERYLKAEGAGTAADPYIPEQNVTVGGGFAIEDRLGNQAEVGAFGALKVTNAKTMVALTFEYALDTIHSVKLANTDAGTSTAQYNGSLLKVQTNGTGTAIVESKKALRYTAGSTGGCYLTASFHGTNTSNTKQLIGLFDETDGFYWGYDGTNFVVAYRNTIAGPDVQAVIDMSAYDLTKINRFRLKFGYLGVGDTSLEIKPDNVSREWETVHVFKTDGALDGRTHSGTPILPVRTEVSATAGEDVYILSGSQNAHTYAKDDIAQDRPFNDEGVRATADMDDPFVAYKSVDTFSGKTNKVRTRLRYAEFATSAEGLYKIVIIKNPATVDGTFSTPVGRENSSVIQVNNTVTTYTGGERIFVTHLAVGSSGTGVGQANLDFSQLGVYADPGDTFVLAVETILDGGGTDQVSWGAFWTEEF